MIINHGKIIGIDIISDRVILTFEDGTKWGNLTAHELEALRDGGGLEFIIEPLLDISNSESSNNGNYREYRVFEIQYDHDNNKHYMIQDYWSYHGDLEPSPEFEEFEYDEFYDILRKTIAVHAECIKDETERYYEWYESATYEDE